MRSKGGASKGPVQSSRSGLLSILMVIRGSPDERDAQGPGDARARAPSNFKFGRQCGPPAGDANGERAQEIRPWEKGTFAHSVAETARARRETHSSGSPALRRPSN